MVQKRGGISLVRSSPIKAPVTHLRTKRGSAVMTIDEEWVQLHLTDLECLLDSF